MKEQITMKMLENAMFLGFAIGCLFTIILTLVTNWLTELLYKRYTYKIEEKFKNRVGYWEIDSEINKNIDKI